MCVYDPSGILNIHMADFITLPRNIANKEV